MTSPDIAFIIDNSKPYTRRETLRTIQKEVYNGCNSINTQFPQARKKLFISDGTEVNFKSKKWTNVKCNLEWNLFISDETDDSEELSLKCVHLVEELRKVINQESSSNSNRNRAKICYFIGDLPYDAYKSEELWYLSYQLKRYGYILNIADFSQHKWTPAQLAVVTCLCSNSGGEYKHFTDTGLKQWLMHTVTESVNVYLRKLHVRDYINNIRNRCSLSEIEQHMQNITVHETNEQVKSYLLTISRRLARDRHIVGIAECTLANVQNHFEEAFREPIEHVEELIGKPQSFGEKVINYALTSNMMAADGEIVMNNIVMGIPYSDLLVQMQGMNLAEMNMEVVTEPQINSYRPEYSVNVPDVDQHHNQSSMLSRSHGSGSMEPFMARIRPTNQPNKDNERIDIDSGFASTDSSVFYLRLESMSDEN